MPAGIFWERGAGAFKGDVAAAPSLAGWSFPVLGIAKFFCGVKTFFLMFWGMDLGYSTMMLAFKKFLKVLKFLDLYLPL